MNMFGVDLFTALLWGGALILLFLAIRHGHYQVLGSRLARRFREGEIYAIEWFVEKNYGESCDLRDVLLMAGPEWKWYLLTGSDEFAADRRNEGRVPPGIRSAFQFGHVRHMPVFQAAARKLRNSAGFTVKDSRYSFAIYGPGLPARVD